MKSSLIMTASSPHHQEKSPTFDTSNERDVSGTKQAGQRTAVIRLFGTCSSNVVTYPSHIF